jgi:CO/xanthine dehydrogenase FAD-binding subunit
VTVLLPRSLDEACAHLARHTDAEVLAGGTDLMVAVNAGRHRVETIVALDRLDDLRGWTRAGDTLVLGAGVTYTELLEPEVAALVPALAQAARTVGSPQIRNAGTIGGNLGTASPAGDTLGVLAALEAVVVLQSTRGRREVPFAEFCLGPKQTARQPDELIVATRVPILDGPQEFLKIGTRNAMVISVASVAVVADRDGRNLRVGLGSVGPTVRRAPDAEGWVADHIDWDLLRVEDPRTYETFGELVGAAARPIDDHRSTAAYRRHGVAVLARRALMRMMPG